MRLDRLGVAKYVILHGVCFYHPKLMTETDTGGEPTHPAPLVPAGPADILKPDRTRPRPRSVGLDVMRFIAVGLVLYAHASMFPSTRKFFIAGYGNRFKIEG